MKLILIASLLATAAPLSAAPLTPAEIAALREAALKDDYAWDITEGLTTEVGPRLAGTEAEARARAWAVAKLKAMGFANVRVETFDMPVWVRGEERAEILSPFPQPLAVTAFGNSGATPPQGIDAELVGVRQRRRADRRARRSGARQDRVRHPRHAAHHGRLGLRPVRRARAARARPSPAARARRRSSSARSAPTITATRTPACRASPRACRRSPPARLSIPDAEQLAAHPEARPAGADAAAS